MVVSLLVLALIYLTMILGSIGLAVVKHTTAATALGLLSQLVTVAIGIVIIIYAVQTI